MKVIQFYTDVNHTPKPWADRFTGTCSVSRWSMWMEEQENKLLACECDLVWPAKSTCYGADWSEEFMEKGFTVHIYLFDVFWLGNEMLTQPQGSMY